MGGRPALQPTAQIRRFACLPTRTGGDTTVRSRMSYRSLIILYFKALELKSPQLLLHSICADSLAAFLRRTLTHTQRTPRHSVTTANKQIFYLQPVLARLEYAVGRSWSLTLYVFRAWDVKTFFRKCEFFHERPT